jgi:hypothetical protein
MKRADEITDDEMRALGFEPATTTHGWLAKGAFASAYGTLPFLRVVLPYMDENEEAIGLELDGLDIGLASLWSARFSWDTPAPIALAAIAVAMTPAT